MSDEPTPEHHHYQGENCAMRGRPCTSPSCWWAVNGHVVQLHEACE